MDEEVKYLLQQERHGQLTIIPILIRPCVLGSHRWLRKLQMYPGNGQSVAVDFREPDVVFSKVAQQVCDGIEAGSPPPGVPETPREIKDCVDTSRLPLTGSLLLGRDAELDRLDAAWEDENTNIVIFKAHGGVGKSTLVRVWTEQMAEDNYRGAKAVFAWSFYSQGTSERVTSADQFMATALEFFGDPDPQKGSAWDRGEQLAKLVAKQRTLLLLDGMEPLQSGHDFDRGEIKDPALKTLLEGLAERNAGLCVISTREEVADLEGAIERVDLEKVSTVAGRALLRIGGVSGTDDELEALVKGFGNHSLALNLLAAYLKWPDAGNASDIPELPDIPEAKGKHARRVMAAFETLFGEGPQLDLLRILDLFDGPVEEMVIRALLADPPIKGLTDHLTRGGARAFASALATLRRAKLLAGESRHDPPRLDSHPLVREHFGEQLERERPEAWRAGHERLFEHYQGVPKENQPSTLEGLAPLYAAVAHGCAAGRHQEAFDEVYWARINRRQDFYPTRKLGAFGSDLAAVSSFLQTPWSKVAGGLPEDNQAFLLNAAGFRLRALGRLREAAEPLEAGLEIRVDQENWKSAAIISGNLSELQLTRGEVEAAVDYARRAVDYADRSGEWYQRLVRRSVQAAAEHQAGRPETAGKLFREAEHLQQKNQPEYPLLYSLRGYQFCDLLLDQGQSAEAQRRATQTLEWVTQQNWLLDIALDHLTLGRAALVGDVPEAATHLDKAVDGLRSAGVQDYVTRGLLARADLHRRQGHFNRSRRDLREVEKIGRRGEMRLHLTDFHLESARLALAESDPAAAREHLDKARQLVNETGYHRRDPDLDEIAAQLASA